MENLFRPAFFDQIMPTSLKYPIAVCIFLILLGTVSSNATPQGFLEGQLKILSRSPVKLADENTAAVAAKNYADYPLIILSRAYKKEITRVTADRDGNYRVALPPGDYILDVQRGESAHFRAKPQPFTVISNATVHVDMTIVTGSSAEASAPQE
ncbi:MAG: hypothetical protein DME40_09740 [Verrucomicrobia bacterium]|nr:MAG: hypothetical protein DME40_09740 [Verrucomicrobiota bacterium]